MVDQFLLPEMFFLWFLSHMFFWPLLTSAQILFLKHFIQSGGFIGQRRYKTYIHPYRKFYLAILV